MRVFFFWGRFNPPTISHYELWHQAALRDDCDRIVIATSQTHNDRNPLPVKNKLQVMAAAARTLPCKTLLLGGGTIRTISDALAQIAQDSEFWDVPIDLVLCGGTDQESFLRSMALYKDDYGFFSADVLVLDPQTPFRASDARSAVAGPDGRALLRELMPPGVREEDSLVDLVYKTLTEAY